MPSYDAKYYSILRLWDLQPDLSYDSNYKYQESYNLFEMNQKYIIKQQKIQKNLIKTIARQINSDVDFRILLKYFNFVSPY